MQVMFLPEGSQIPTIVMGERDEDLHERPLPGFLCCKVRAASSLASLSRSHHGTVNQGQLVAATTSQLRAWQSSDVDASAAHRQFHPDLRLSTGAFGLQLQQCRCLHREPDLNSLCSHRSGTSSAKLCIQSVPTTVQPTSLT